MLVQSRSASTCWLVFWWKSAVYSVTSYKRKESVLKRRLVGRRIGEVDMLPVGISDLTSSFTTHQREERHRKLRPRIYRLALVASGFSTGFQEINRCPRSRCPGTKTVHEHGFVTRCCGTTSRQSRSKHEPQQSSYVKTSDLSISSVLLLRASLRLVNDAVPCSHC